MFVLLKVWLPRVSFQVYMIKTDNSQFTLNFDILNHRTWHGLICRNYDKFLLFGGKIHVFLQCPWWIDPAWTAPSESRIFFLKSQSCNHNDIFHFWMYTRLIPMTKELTQAFNTIEGLSFHPSSPTPLTTHT